MKPARRAGFSLLEVLLATSILVGSLVVLSELANVGRLHIDDVDRLTTAQQVCRAKLNAILAGAEPLLPVAGEPIGGFPGWLATVQVEPTGERGLQALRVTVREDVPEEQAAREFTLVRWIRETDAPGIDTLSTDELDRFFFETPPDEWLEQ
jgi:hypothetical protein